METAHEWCRRVGEDPRRDSRRVAVGRTRASLMDLWGSWVGLGTRTRTAAHPWWSRRYTTRSLKCRGHTDGSPPRSPSRGAPGSVSFPQERAELCCISRYSVTFQHTDETLTQAPMAVKITERAIKALAPPRRGSRLIWDTELTGFALRVYAPTKAQPKGARTFVLSYRHNSSERRARVGSWPDWSASEARAEAKKLRQRVDRGEDPASKRRKRRGAPTMADLSARNQGPRKVEQPQHVADVHHGNPVALDHAITDSETPVLANHTVGSLLSLLMTGDWQSQAQSASYKRVKLNLAVEPDLAHVLSPVEIALASDPQMRGVWKVLTRRRRDGGFVYPARSAWWQRYQTPAGAPPAEAARVWQGEAMLQLFDTALSCQLLPLVTMTRRQAEQQRD